jgi:ankyrin repeat protein
MNMTDMAKELFGMQPVGRRLYNSDELLSCGVKERALGERAAQIDCKAKLAKGADPNSCNGIGQTALHIAAMWGAIGVGRALIEGGAQVDRRNNPQPLGRGTPLMAAAGRDQIDFAGMLLEFGADPGIKDDRGNAAWQYVSAAQPDFRVLLGGPSPELCQAVAQGDFSRVTDIARRKPELVGLEDGDGDTPLIIAIQQGHWKIANWLVIHPAAMSFINESGSDGERPLHLAARAENLELVDTLLRAGANSNLKSIRKTEYTSGNYDRIDPCTGQKVPVSAEHCTPLFQCARNGNINIAQLLINAGCNLNAADGDGCTALYVALEEETIDIAELLLSAGASPDIGNSDIDIDNTLLAWAASRRRLDHVELLLKHGANPNKPGKSGMYPLHMAARVASKTIVEALLAKAADAVAVCPVSSSREPTVRHVTALQMAEKNPQAAAASCMEVLRAAEAVREAFHTGPA